MPKPQIDPRKIVFFTGSGISAPSGIPTFRSGNGLWHNHRIEDVATLDAWHRDPELVLQFYNERRAHAANAEPNAAHRAIADLERCFDVVVITQNVDNLHERAGSSNVIHLHGELSKARGAQGSGPPYEIGSASIALGDRCAQGSQLRPHIVWFGEEILHFSVAKEHFLTAGRVIIVGTSLVVQPAAGLVKHARYSARKLIVDIKEGKRPFGFQFVLGSADVVLPQIINNWMNEDDPKTAQ